jgi:hypothetical protein
MIVSRGRKFVFVHIPKTGGTALTLALESRAMKDDILIGDTPKAQARRARTKADPATARLRKHSPLADLDTLLPAGELANFFCFSLVRNPWDRLVSYYHWLRGQSFDHAAVTLAKSRDFSAFINAPATQVAEARWPARAYLTDAAGDLRATAFLRLEHLEADIPALESHLGFGLLPLPRQNVSARTRDWRGHYTDADAALIARLCAQDIADFDYRFDP